MIILASVFTSAECAMTTESDTELVNKLRSFCAKHRIATVRTLIITIQKNRTTSFASLVVDFEAGRIMKHYPIMDIPYRELRVGNFNVCFADDLQQQTEDATTCTPQQQQPRPDLALPKDAEEKPFCCSSSGLSAHRPRTVTYESAFAGFVAGRGNYPDIVFEVKRQVNNGALLSTKYYQLLHDGYVDVTRTGEDGKFSAKIHSFKNYICARHNLFFAVDLYSARKGPSSEGYNYHHMRLNPFTRIVDSVLD